MRAAWVLIGLLATACPYHGRDVADDVGDDVPVPDAPSVDAQEFCDPGETSCAARVRRVCGDDHQWDVAQDTECDFTCVSGECVAASNLLGAEVASCEGAEMHPLTPTTGAITVTEPSGDVVIRCDDGCGDGTEIRGTRVGGSPGLAWFCLSTVDIPAGLSVDLPGSGGPSESVVWIVDGPVSLGGRIVFDGGNGQLVLGGEGAPGGSDGGDLQTTDSTAGHPGDGDCPGSGGSATGSVTQVGAGGGGGGGFSQVGGSGGSGRSPNNTQTGNGGTGGNTCGTDDLKPLVGGSGGGGGADGNCSADCGWPGGGGGGAIQISSRTSIVITGGISARGGNGNGFGVAFAGEGGGGGGGAGGAILLESPSVTVSGTLEVDGGDGGISLAGEGGDGASAGTSPSTGASAAAGAQGGAGGGGSGGRIRVHAVAPLCVGVSPIIACTTAVMP